MQRATRLPGRRHLGRLVEMLAAGCHSELELWGYPDVFDVPGLRDRVRQRRVQVGGRSYSVDLAFDEQRLAVELDGRDYHASPAQWERDIRRDLAWPRSAGRRSGCRIVD
ncbi:MAG: uncharacterized protein JWO57_4478 [Pseudonocardiales bacterium]|nr:uncharacterized protein [Pseudonocardiales bacterium]